MTGSSSSILREIDEGRQSRLCLDPPKQKQARGEASLFCARLALLPTAPVAMMMVVMVTMPAVPPVMMTVPPMHFRGRRLRVLLNRRGGAGIAERQRVGALGRASEREHRANGGEPQ